MKQEYAILREEGARFAKDLMQPSIGASSRVNVPSEPILKLSNETLDIKEFTELSKEPETIGLAPKMPLKLISPLARDDERLEGYQDTGNTAWGINAVGAGASPYSGKGAKVAILDTGIEASHAAFAGVNIVERNFTTEAGNDLHGHGTHVAGTVCGRDVNGTRIGVATGVEDLYIGKVLGQGGGSSVDLYDAIHWANQQGAHIISMSLGIDFPGQVKALIRQGYPDNLAASIALEGYRANVDLFSSLSTSLMNLSAWGNGSVVVAASGNESTSQYDITVSPPAASKGIVSVGAMGILPGGKYRVADFSNKGVDLCGPGVDVLSAQLGGALVSMDGTSMATPHVAGVMALWVERMIASDSWDPVRLANRVIGNASRQNVLQGQRASDVGNGMVQAP